MSFDAPVAESPAEESSSGVWAARVAGVVAAAASLAASELLAGLLTAIPSLVSGVATFVIDNVPTFVKDLAIEVFGTADKLALGVGIIIVSLALGAWVGPLALGDRRIAWAVFAVFGLAGALAASLTPQADAFPALVNGAVAAIAGVAALEILLRLSARRVDSSRRDFIVGAGSLVALAVLSTVVGRSLASATRATLAGRGDISLPPSVSGAIDVTDAMTLEVEEITPLVTPNADFFRIDVVPFGVPRVDISTWTVKVTGMVDREIELSFQDLQEMALEEKYITLACVSNEVGGGLVGNAKWLGVPLSKVLEMAGPQAGAEQVVGRSVDDFTVGFPIEAAFDGRDALVAIGMNDEPLPMEHGYPARLVVSGLYGYVSATKWLSEIELTTWDAFDAYWIPRGWAKEGPVVTQSRIDTPRGDIGAGPVAIAGVAWAPDRGISRVEVKIDDADWVEAELAEAISEDTWRQWKLAWDPEPGRHTISVRATDGNGDTQTAEESPPAPDGATGYHTVVVVA